MSDNNKKSAEKLKPVKDSDNTRVSKRTTKGKNPNSYVEALNRAYQATAEEKERREAIRAAQTLVNMKNQKNHIPKGSDSK
jgi:hypothetical protein